MYMRVKEGGAIEAAKPVLEGLSPEQQQAVAAALGAQPVSLTLPGQPSACLSLARPVGGCGAGRSAVTLGARWSGIGGCEAAQGARVFTEGCSW